MIENKTTEPAEVSSLGDLHAAAKVAIAAGEKTVTVDADALAALCRSEAWAHERIGRIERRD